jgi:hypothetical protein
LALLNKFRREPADGAWFRIGADRGSADVANLAWNGPRMELRRGNRTIRTEGDDAAVADRDLDLVELGTWGEALRQIADSRFPWMPHRSNQDLARMFRVQSLDEQQKRTKGDGRDTVRLRLVPRGLPADGGTWLELELSRSSGLTVRCVSFWQGQRTGEVQFPKPEKDDPPGRIAVVQDGAQKPSARWAAAAGHVPGLPGAKGPAESPLFQVLAVDQGWGDCTVWDRRGHQPVSGSFAWAVDALRKQNWRQACAGLDEAAKSPGHRPLVLLLRTWCRQQDPRLGSEQEMLADLREVVASGRSGLVDFIGEGRLTRLSAAQRYEVLKLQPSGSRTAVNLDNMARLAAEIGRLEETLNHTTAALAIQPDDGRAFDRWQTKVETLLRLNRPDDAQKSLRVWEAAARQPVGQIADMARLLAKYGKTAPARALLDRALGAEGLAPAERCRLLSARAQVQVGMARWSSLVEAAALMPEAGPERMAAVRALLAELTDEAAGQLAASTKDTNLKWQLLLRQAEVTLDLKLRADVGWRLFEAGRLTGQDSGWICRAWNQTDQHGHTIRFCEDCLRAGRALSDAETAELEEAYRATDRPEAVRRVRTADPGEVKPPAQGGMGLGDRTGLSAS